jgi:hypothetical protein
MAISVGELISQLQDIEAENGSDLFVITDNEVAIAGAEYNTDGGSPAVVIVTE